MSRAKKKNTHDWVEIDLGNGVRKRVRKVDAAPPPTPPVPTCPLAPHIPLASVGRVEAYVIVSPRTNWHDHAPSLVGVDHLTSKDTIESAAKRLGGGSFVLVFYDPVTNEKVGESHVFLPGEPKPITAAAIKYDAEKRVADRKRDADKATADTEFRKMLSTDEDSLTVDLAEIHHWVVRARFSTDAAERDASLTNILVASDRGLTTVVKRLKERPVPVPSWISSPAMLSVLGIGAVASAAYRLFGPVVAKSARTTAVPPPTAAGIGVGKAT